MLPLRERLDRKRQSNEDREVGESPAAKRKPRNSSGVAAKIAERLPAPPTSPSADRQAKPCCLKLCRKQSKQIDPENDDRVEVRASLPPSGLAGVEKSLVRWSTGGDALFHEICWQHVLGKAKQRVTTKSVKEGGPARVEKLLIRDAAKTCEKHDSVLKVQEHAKHIAALLRNAKHCIAFTGAGISTAAGIGDYRGRSGKWTDEDRAKASAAIGAAVQTSVNAVNDSQDSDDDDEEEGGVAYEELRPTYTHEALALLIRKGLLHHVISQNGDGLHGLSGVEQSNMSELHGNVFVESCEKCARRYSRPYYTLNDEAGQYFEEMGDQGQSSVAKPKNALQCTTCGLTHRTGRRCTQKGCKGLLKDSIINFGDNLEEGVLDTAQDHARRSDLCLSLGTTMQVTPACELVEMGQTPLRLVICNRQETALDDLAGEINNGQPLGARVFGDCDLLMKHVMRELLPLDEVKKWEEDRPKRLLHYDTQRTNT